MNLKPTKKKVIWTLILALLINVAVPLINWVITTITWPLVQRYIETNKVQGLFGPSILPTLTAYLLSPTNIVVFVLELFVIYMIWSLFQKKRMPRMPARK
jgi:hypothetical protein